MEISNELMNEIMRFNSHPMADLLRPGFSRYRLDENQWAINTYEIKLLTGMSKCKFGKVKNIPSWKFSFN